MFSNVYWRERGSFKGVSGSLRPQPAVSQTGPQGEFSRGGAEGAEGEERRMGLKVAPWTMTSFWYTAGHHMVERTGILNAEASRHAPIVWCEYALSIIAS